MVNIRPALPADYPKIGELYDQIGSLHCLHLPHIFRDAGKTIFPYPALSAFLETGEGTIFAAETDGEIVGFVAIIVRNAPDLPILQPRRMGVIDSVGVAPQAREQGIGRALMEKAHAWAKTQGATSVELNVYEFNQAARHLYETMGYITINRKMGLKL